MPAAPPFPEPWGWSALTHENGTNLLNASFESWKHVGLELNATTGLPAANATPIGWIFLWSFIPLILGGIVYTRSQKMYASWIVIVLSLGFEAYFGLIAWGYVGWAYFIFFIIGIAYWIFGGFWK